MAKKIPFNVVFSSDEDPLYPASELNTHGPTVHGWRSAPGSTITSHDIVLRFQKPAKICRIQVLAHQFLIPQKVELWLHYSPKGIPSTPSSQCFDFLGFIALSDNAATNYKSRELQSVTVSPRKGTHLKLRLSPSYENKLNEQNQISLIAVNVLGIDLDNLEPNTESEIVLSDAGEPILSSICDDLLFSMYVEESIEKIIREMEEKKAKAVSVERFEYARKLKLCMSALRLAGERLGRYALAKRQAVQQEDFTTAKLRKEQIEMYRSSVFKHLMIDQLQESLGPISENDVACDVYASKPTLPIAPSLQEVATALALAEAQFMSPKSGAEDKSSTDGGSIANQSTPSDTLSSHSAGSIKKLNEELLCSPKMMRRSPSRGSPMSSCHGSLRRRNKSAPRNSYEDYEERAIPTLRQECQSNILDSDSGRGRSRLNDRERRQAALPILVYGNELVEQFYSRQFQDREDGLVRLRNFLKGPESETDCTTSANKIARSAALLLHRAVRDAVYSVFSQATETVRALFLEFVPGRVLPNEVARCVDRLLPELLAKSGDPSARIHTLAQHTILSIAACPEVRQQHLVAPSLSRTVGSGTHPRLALSRMQMLEQLVLSQGMSNDKHSGLTCRVLSECGCSGIHHPAEPVRKVAERILLLVYKVNPRLVRKQLPPDDDITRRNLLYRQLFTEFDKFDIERKKEMVVANNLFSQSNSDPTSPPPKENNTKLETNFTSPVLGVKVKDTRHQNHNTFCFESKSPDTQSSPKLQSDKRILKSKSGHCIGTSATTNGYSNDKQKYNEKLKQSMNISSTVGSRKSSNSNSESLEEADAIRCPFCDWTCVGDDPNQLDKHYWKSCPFLTKCPQCSQVLEVAALNFHLTNECEAKNSYVNCTRCTESVHKQLFELHLMEDYCRELKTGAARCPLCHDDVHLPLDGGWKLHLLTASGCPGNARRRQKKN